LTKWAIELGEHDITYKPRVSIKGQALADFLVEIPKEAESMKSRRNRGRGICIQMERSVLMGVEQVS
jgi:hypothetical protein